MSYGSEFEEISSVLNIVYSKYMTVKENGIGRQRQTWQRFYFIFWMLPAYINEVGADALNEKHKNKDHILVIWSMHIFTKIDAGIA